MTEKVCKLVEFVKYKKKASGVCPMWINFSINR